jgi:hypothetical protein
VPVVKCFCELNRNAIPIDELKLHRQTKLSQRDKMAPSAISDSASRREVLNSLPPPKLYPVKEAKFEKFVTPQIDGRERALDRGAGSTAIVIDNGT